MLLGSFVSQIHTQSNFCLERLVKNNHNAQRQYLVTHLQPLFYGVLLYLCIVVYRKIVVIG